MDFVEPSSRETVEAVEGVYLTQLAVGENMSIQHLEMDPGARVPEHSHHHEQAGFVYEGEQTFVVDGDAVVVGVGESYVLESDESHAAENRGETTLKAIDVFSPPRPDPHWKD